jgi:hypothetical protein
MLTKNEIVELTPEFFDLAELILQAKESDSSGGSRITKSEAKKIGLTALKLGFQLIKDVLD